MERVAFLIEQTGERITCLLNPENLETRRSSGVRMRREAGGFLAGRVRSDHPLISTGGGVTELDLHLLFDTGIAQADRPQTTSPLQTGGPPAAEKADVRALTRPLWNLTENALSGGFGAPPCVRFIWGKSWNVPGVVISVAERLEQFDADGSPQRSWVSLRLRRVEEPEPRAVPPMPVTPQFEMSAPGGDGGDGGEDRFPAIEVPVDDDGTPLNRLDQIAAERYGNPELARPLAEFNDLDDLLTFAEGLALALPSAAQLERQA